MLGALLVAGGLGLGGLLPVQGSFWDGRSSTHGHTRGEGTVDGWLLLLRLWKAFLQFLLKVFPVVEEDSLGLGLILLVHCKRLGATDKTWSTKIEQGISGDVMTSDNGG